MSLTNSQYESIHRKYEERQLHNRHSLEERFLEIYAQIPAYKELDDTISTVSLAQGKKLVMGDEDALFELKSILSDLTQKKEVLLTQAGYPADYLSPIYECTDCKDTGYIDGVKCHCFKQAMVSLLYAQSNILEMMNQENFSNLSTEYYQGEDLVRFEKAVITCKNFTNNFNSDYHNLFFYGTVGTGKSFLSGCIAKEVLDKGCSVIYFSAAKLFETLSKYSFDYKSRDDLSGIYEDIYTCDLLIIDDLGTEMTNKFVSTQLFSCLNERHLRKKSTIISTNLSLEDLRETYSERIFSRITSNYEVCKLSGPDIRMYKKRVSNRK